MPRNFQRRVEVMFPIEDEGLRDRVFDEILGIALTDNVKSRRLGPDGSYARVRPEGATNGVNGSNGVTPGAAGARPLRSQYRFMELAREKAQAGPALPGSGGAYHVRTTPPTRTGGTTPTTTAPAQPTPPAPTGGSLPS
jgi:polyphosphate kinase